MNQNSNNSCLKFMWKIDSQLVSNTYYFHAPITRNGYHTYCLKITDTCNKCDTVICQTRNYYCNNLGINTETFNNNVQIYPTPAKQLLTISSTITIASAEILNISGQCLWKGVLTTGDTILDIAAWPAGMYIITLRTDEGIITKKLLKE
jgi:hypothetical protein